MTCRTAARVAALALFLLSTPQSFAQVIAIKDASALAGALQAAKAGSTLVLPAGKFAPITLPAGVSLRGAGADQTIVDGGTADAALAVAGGKGVTIEDLSVHTHGAMGIQISDASDVTLRQVKIRGGAIGLRIVNVSQARVENVAVDQSPTGMNFARVSKSSVVNCTVYRANSVCLSLVDMTDSAIFNNILAESGIGILINGKHDGLSVDHNLYLALFVGRIEGNITRVSLGTWRAVTGGFDSASVQLPVKFADADKGDYHAVSTLEWAPWQQTTHGWGIAELGGFKAPANDIDGHSRGESPELGVCETSAAQKATSAGTFEITTDAGLKSAGLFTKDGTSIHYLFQALTLKKGKYEFALPSRTTIGAKIEAGDYELRVVEANLKWTYRGITANNGISNSELDADFDSTVRVAFAADGALLLGNGWNERLVNLLKRDVKTRKGQWFFNGSSNNQGLAVAGDGTILLLREAGSGYTLARIDPADGKPMEWAKDKSAITLESKDKSIDGIAELDGKLYLAANSGTLYITSLKDPKLENPITLATPRLPMADRKHKLVWLVSGEKVIAIDGAGQVKHELAEVASPLGVATNGERLAIASYDDGKIHFFDISDPAKPKADGTLGKGDGPYGPIEAGRFWFQKGAYNSAWRVAIDMDAKGNLAISDRAGRVCVFDKSGTSLYDSFAQFGNSPYQAYFNDNNGRTRFFDNNGIFTWWIDDKAGTWKPDAYWAKPSMNKAGTNSPIQFFSAGGKKFAVMFYSRMAADGKNKQEGAAVLRYDNYVGRPIAFYTSGKGGWVVIHDTNNDGIIDLQDGDGAPVLDVKGKQVTRALVGRWICGLPDGSVRNGIEQLWKLKGLDKDGNPDFEFPAEPVIVLKTTHVPSPYDFAKKSGLGGQSESQTAPDGDLLATLQAVEGSPSGMGLSNSGAVDMVRLRPDGSLRWYLPMNDYGPVQGVKAVDKFILSSWGHQTEWIGLDNDGLVLGYLGYPAEAKWGGYWVDHPGQYRMYIGNDGKAQVTIGEYVRTCHHWMTLDYDNYKKSTFPVKISEDVSKQLADRPAVPVTVLAKPQQPRITIPRLKAPMKIDGDLTKWREAGITPQIVMTPVTASAAIKGPKDASAVIRLAYEGDSIYVQILRFDDVVVLDHTIERGTHLQDTMEMMLNGFFPSGFQFSVSKFGSDGDQIVRRRFFFKNNQAYQVPADHAPRIVKVLDDAKSVEERKLIESVYGVDMSKCKVIVHEFKLPIDKITWKDSEDTLFEVGPGKTFWIGFMLDDNDVPGTDVQNLIVWPASYGTFAPKETGAFATFE